MRNGKTIVYGLIFILLFTLLGFRIAHPQSGLKSAAGPASSSLVVYKHTSSFSAGDKVVVKLQDSKLSPAVGIVRSASEGNIQIQTDNLVINVPTPDVRGKLIGVLPFLGYLFSIIGR